MLLKSQFVGCATCKHLICGDCHNRCNKCPYCRTFYPGNEEEEQRLRLGQAIQAVRTGDLPAVREFVQTGGDVNGIVNVACMLGQLDILKYLMSIGATANRGILDVAFSIALTDHDLEMCHFLTSSAGVEITQDQALDVVALAQSRHEQMLAVVQHTIETGEELTPNERVAMTALQTELDLITASLDAVNHDDPVFGIVDVIAHVCYTLDTFRDILFRLTDKLVQTPIEELVGE